MIRRLLILALVAGLPAHADTCGPWVAEVWETEGGEAMTAWVCTPSVSGRDAMIFVQCGGPGMLGLSYDDGGDGVPPGGNPDYAGTVAFASREVAAAAEVIYSGIDGTLFAELAQDDPLAELLLAGGEVTVTPEAAEVLPHSFTLEGAPDAISQVLAECAE
jgi:hypothetical protein